jgi:putative heme iron utilization protein
MTDRDREPSHAELARTLVARAKTATLSTLALDPAGHPYGSLVSFALDGATPILLLSELAEHTRNLRADARASLLVAEPGEAQPLAHARVTLLGRCALVADTERDRALTAYLGAHPDAAQFAGFRDFHLWRLDVEAARYIAGFGRMSWIAGADFTAAGPG